MSHHLMLQSLLYFFNRHLIYFRYFFHCIWYPRLLSGSISQKFCQLTTNLVQTVKRKILINPFQCVCTAESIFIIFIFQCLF